MRRGTCLAYYDQCTSHGFLIFLSNHLHLEYNIFYHIGMYFNDAVLSNYIKQCSNDVWGPLYDVDKHWIGVNTFDSDRVRKHDPRNKKTN